ncbi:MAG: hypothetical protein E7141_04925 [Rikenellaceae bacterium]|nr:hypothetical protein [Rikenellaceae bacterium]
MTVSEAYNTLLALSRADKPYSSAEESIISNLYTEVTGKKVRDCNCRDKWRDAVIEALLYLKKHKAMREKCDYKLRAGVILHISGSSEVYTNDNLTNEVAEKFLKDNPNAVGRFAVIPQPKAESKPKRKKK